MANRYFGGTSLIVCCLALGNSRLFISIVGGIVVCLWI